MKNYSNYRILALLLATSCCGLVAQAQTAPLAPQVASDAGTLQQFLSGDLVPLDLKFSQMQKGWSRVNLERKGAATENSTENTARSPDSVEQGFRRYFGKDASSVFTQGRTVNLNGAEQLVVYRAQFPSSNEVRTWFESRFTDEMKVVELNPEKFMDLTLPLMREFLDTVPLRASLVSVDTIGSLENVQSFDYERAFTAFGSDAREQYKADIQSHLQGRAASSRVSLQLLAQGLNQYMQDYDETLPPLDSWEVANKTLQPYIKSPITLAQPEQQIHTNPLLSGKKLAHLQPYAQSLLVFYSDPDPSGNRWLVFLDGKIEEVAATRWPQLKKASRLP